MPPKPKKTKDEVIDAAVNVIRNGGLDAVTARNIVKYLDISPSSLFTHFPSMEDIRKAALEKIRGIYEEYATRGFEMNPPFKGFGMEVVRFAAEEPNLFTALFMKRGHGAQPADIADIEGHNGLIVKSISDTFGLDEEKSNKLFTDLWVYTCGIATLTAAGVCSFSKEEISVMLGNACRGFIMAMLATPDDHIGIMPEKDAVIVGSISDYLYTNTISE